MLSSVELVVMIIVLDVNVEQPDKKSIMMYLMCCYEILTAKHNNDHNNVRLCSCSCSSSDGGRVSSSSVAVVVVIVS